MEEGHQELIPGAEKSKVFWGELQNYTVRHKECAEWLTQVERQFESAASIKRL